MELTYITFPDKIEVDQNNENINFITGKNINEIKTVVNNAVTNLTTLNSDYLLMNSSISNLSAMYFDIINDYLLSSEFIEKMSDIDSALSSLNNKSSINFKDINSIRNETYTLNKNLNKLSDLTFNLDESLITVSSDFTKFKNDTKLNFLKVDKNVEKLNKVDDSIIKSMKDIDIKNQSYYFKIENKFSDFDELKNIVNENIKKITTIESIVSNSILNQILLDNTNILYFLDQCQERLFLQDMRSDHLERMIRGIEDPKNWDDWHRLFSMLNLLKLKLSRLSLFRHVNMKDIFFDDNELKQFKHILNEIGLKLDNFTNEELDNIDINKDELLDIMENIDNERYLDPGPFEFYPNYPELS